MVNSTWTKTEDEVLTAAVQKYGIYQWDRIASLFSKKAAKQVKERWYNWVSPTVHHRDWFADEDSKLIKLSQELPNQWNSISQGLPGRTPEQCYTRYLSLEGKSSMDALQESAEDDGGEEDQELVAEATARFSNALGRKGKRKLRERNEAEARHDAEIESHRQGKKKKLAPAVTEAESVLKREAEILARSREAPEVATKRELSKNKDVELLPPRYVKRRKLEIYPPKIYEAPNPEQLYRVRAKLEKLPAPISSAIDLPDIPRPRRTTTIATETLTDEQEKHVDPKMLATAKALVDAEMQRSDAFQRNILDEVCDLRGNVARDLNDLIGTYKQHLVGPSSET